ncbi:MAG: Prolyl oligopeptidase [Candidatus Nomurabacteria bacterium GW2011_GWB1_37_5]|uniref:prolyl oligopeptidase n=1 Tax=Candidatus Nomurabacteria bacterium GW2011_GWB1_37_5 TaxID=1618742 RepID=A0A0G0JEX2_9BACT|nr:MAG: Prolyl oligopeptidase [Candidatus Nomurabacteria bacterium GW2011_GWB1_37_5]
MKFPVTKKENIVDELFGYKIFDPFRWLENGENEDVKKWVEEQNSFAFSSLKGVEFDIFQKELALNYKYTSFSNPVPVKGKYFYSERKPDENQNVIYYKIGIDGELVKLVDPNILSKESTVAVDYWGISRSGKYLIYGLSEGGTEMATLHIKDVDKNSDLNEKIINCRYSSTAWLPDDSGFFYTRNPRPGTAPKGEEHLHTKVYFHKIGDNPDNDEMIFGDGRPKDDMISITISLDGRLLSISASQNWIENEIYIYDISKKNTKLLIKKMKAKFHLSFLKDKILIYTNYKADNYRILQSSYEDMLLDIEKWKEFLPEEKSLLSGFNITEEKILVEYLVNASSKVKICDYNGKHLGDIPLPEYSSLSGISTRKTEKEFFYSVTSFTFPPVIYRYIPDEDKYLEYNRIENPINPDDYIIKQEWFLSSDGTKVPMFIFHRKELKQNGDNPTILYGYGGFASALTPSFSRGYMPWVNKGGIFVYANIRGGSEFGKSWHLSAIKENKQKSFDDFIAAAEHLIRNKYTSSRQLGVLGGSNGGLLVSVAAVQRPDLFGAVVSNVPLTDMVRFHKFGIAARWVHEYGNPETKEELENILKWSPYHNIKDGIRYPNFLFVTGEKDSRVDPLHSRKMAALLQSVVKDNNVLLFTETEAGHGAGKPIYKIVEAQALKITFLAKYLGLSI